MPCWACDMDTQSCALILCTECRCLWRFTADNLQNVQDNPDWECPCCRPPPALALQYPPQPLPRQRTSLQLGGPDRMLRTGGSFSGRSVEGVKRRPSQSGASSPRGRVSAAAEVSDALLCGPLWHSRASLQVSGFSCVHSDDGVYQAASGSSWAFYLLIELKHETTSQHHIGDSCAQGLVSSESLVKTV